MSKADARKELQRRLVIIRSMLKDEIEAFAIEHELEFSFMGMKYFLKDPGGTNRYAKEGIFISEGEWESSSWGCGGGESSDKFDEWEEKHFSYEDDEENDEDDE